MPNINPNSTDYVHSFEPNTNDLVKAMDYTVDGKPAIRVLSNIQGDITIEGDVTIPGVVKVENADGTSLAINDNNGSITVDGTVTANVTFPASQTVNGTVNIGTMPEVEIKNDAGNPIPVSKNTSVNSDSNPIWVKGTSDTSFFSPVQSDAFGRLRVSGPYTLFDSFHRYQDNGKIGTLTEGGATSVHDANSSSVVNTVTGTSGSKVYRESNRVFAYQPGKSLQILETFVLAPPLTGLRQRYGFFDADNGIYLEQAGSTYYLVRRSSSSGTLNNFRVAQTDWNIDPLDGSGVSTRVIDFTKAQIFNIDIEWLGVGSVRCGFVIDGEIILAHIFHHANIIANTYMTTSCLPVRAEIENTETNNVASSLRVICATVISEGGYELRGRSRSIGHRITAPRTTIAAQNGVIIPMISIRLKADRLGAIVVPTNFSFGAITGANYEFYIINGATTSGGSWNSAGTDSAVEYNLTPTSYTNGTVLDQGYVISTNQSSVSPVLKEYPFAFQLERNTLTSPATRYEFLIATATTTNSTSQVHSIGWEEIT
jgi:hypothetical protein